MSEPLSFVSGIGAVARKYGLDESVFLHEIVHWFRQNRAQGSNFRDGRWWTYNTLKGFAELFPWWTEKQVRRIVDSCRSKGALLTAQYDEDSMNRTLWYSPSDELLSLYGEDRQSAENAKEAAICPDGQMDLPESADANAQTGERNAQMGKCYKVTGNNTGNIPPISPQGEEHEGIKKICSWKEPRFLRFWAFYRDTFCASDHSRAGERGKAADAWDKLKPDDLTIGKMGAKLEAVMKTRQWQDGIGIAMASTFLNGIRLGRIDLDELPAASAPPSRRQYKGTEIIDGREVDVYE